MADQKPAIPQITPLEGKTVLDDKMSFEPERLSYESAAEVAGKIAASVANANKVEGKTVVIVGTGLLIDFANLTSVHATMSTLGIDYDSVVNTAALLQAGPVGSGPSIPETKELGVVEGISAALGLVSLFRQDVEFRGIKTVVDPLAFEIALAVALRSQKAQKVYVPDLAVIRPGPAVADSLAGVLESLHRKRAAAWEATAPYVAALVKAEAELDKAVVAKKDDEVKRLTALVSELRRNLDPLTAQLTDADRRLSGLEADLNKAEDKGGLTMLGRLIRAETLLKPEHVLVHATIVSGGGQFRIIRNLLRTLFRGDGVSVTAGVAVRWAVLDAGGAVLLGGIETAKRKEFL